MRKLAILFTLLVFAAPAAAQSDMLPLFARVQPDRVIMATAVEGMGVNERVYEGAEAGYIARMVQSYYAQFTATDRIQPFSWDFDNWRTRDDFTPLAFMVAVREDWTIDGRLYQHYSTLSCYDVGDPEYVDCWQFEGGASDMLLSWHRNSVRLDTESAQALINIVIK